MLDLEQIFPHLFGHNLLTDSELELLQAPSVQCSRKIKISKLVTGLPRKGPDALSRFVECLIHSADGTGHFELANRIRDDCAKVLKEKSSKRTISSLGKFNRNEKFNYYPLPVLPFSAIYHYTNVTFVCG